MKYIASKIKSGWYYRPRGHNSCYIYVINVGKYINIIESCTHKNLRYFDFEYYSKAQWNDIYSGRITCRLKSGDDEKEKYIFKTNLIKSIFRGDHDYYLKNNKEWGT